MMNMKAESLQTDLLAKAELGVKKALKKGAQEAEAFVSTADMISVNAKKVLLDARRGSASGIGIMVALDGRVGFAAVSGTGDLQIDNAAEEAVTVARIRPPDRDFKHLPDPVKLPSRDGLLDEQVLLFSEESALKAAAKLAESTYQYDKRVDAVYVNVSVHRGAYAVANSRGVAGSTRTAHESAAVNCTASESGRQKTGAQYAFSRNVIDLNEVGPKAAERAVAMLKAKPLGKTLKTPVIWENMSIGDLFGYMLGAALNARFVQEGRSCFKDKIGEKIAGTNITVIDDGQLMDGVNTSRIDAEGVPRRTTAVISEGVLMTCLYNSYVALKEDRESTGNAARNWPEPFLDTPGVSTTNLVVKTGSRNFDELVNGMDEGILVIGEVMGMGNSNTITGEFSLVAPATFLVKNGIASSPLEPVTIAGNFFDALKSIREIGTDGLLTRWGKIPSMVFNELSVSG
jgi:PmbA protein